MELWQRFSPRLRKAVLLAHTGATADNTSRISTEGLLLALLAQEGGAAAQVLSELGVDRRELAADPGLQPVAAEPPTPPVSEVQFTPNASKALSGAYAVAQNADEMCIGTGHLLLGILRLKDCSAARVLGARGVAAEAAEAHLAAMATEQRGD